VVQRDEDRLFDRRPTLNPVADDLALFQFMRDSGACGMPRPSFEIHSVVLSSGGDEASTWWNRASAGQVAAGTRLYT
jgi:hypothetical protein